MASNSIPATSLAFINARLMRAWFQRPFPLKQRQTRGLQLTDEACGFLKPARCEFPASLRLIGHEIGISLIPQRPDLFPDLGENGQACFGVAQGSAGGSELLFRGVQ
jgi:hypothetical protein